MNKNKWQGTVDFPGLAELVPKLTLESILRMDDDFYRKHINPKFFYMGTDELWKWQVNALCAMRNSYKDAYAPYICAACKSENEKVREMANVVAAACL